MTRSIAAQVGLLSFGVAVLAGLLAGNGALTILGRGIGALLIGVLLGHVVAAAARTLLREHLLGRKMQIDRDHLAALKALTADEEEPETTSA